MWESKLSSTAYKLTDPATVFKGSWWKEEDPVFMGRLATACVELGIKTLIPNSAYRPTSAQELLYKQFLAGNPKVPSAAKPGTSWHEIRLAIDTSTYPLRGLTDAQVRKYGLCKPIKSEGWHLQPIETAKMGIKCNKSMAPVWKEDEVEIEKLSVEMNGKEALVDAVRVNNEYYLKVRSLADAQNDDKLTVAYDAARKKVIITSR